MFECVFGQRKTKWNNSIKKRKFIELFQSKWNTYELFKYPLGIYLERTDKAIGRDRSHERRDAIIIVGVLIYFIENPASIVGFCSVTHGNDYLGWMQLDCSFNFLNSNAIVTRYKTSFVISRWNPKPSPSGVSAPSESKAGHESIVKWRHWLTPKATMKFSWKNCLINFFVG